MVGVVLLCGLVRLGVLRCGMAHGSRQNGGGILGKNGYFYPFFDYKWTDFG